MVLEVILIWFRIRTRLWRLTGCFMRSSSNMCTHFCKVLELEEICDGVSYACGAAFIFIVFDAQFAGGAEA